MMLKLNVGCASRPLEGYVNIDMDTTEDLKKRYPHLDIPDIPIYQYDIFDLPYKDGEVDEVRADAFIEHLSFKEEPKFFYEVARVLKPGGLFRWCVPDFEDAVKLWLQAKDDWKDFYRDDDEAVKSQHWFGTYTYNTDNRWGYLMAMLFGSQNGEGQYHRNAYTEGKVRAMMSKLGFEVTKLERFKWKEDRDLMIDIEAKKI
jgi:predicted SAM-dependent methyltransferase